MYDVSNKKMHMAEKLHSLRIKQQKDHDFETYVKSWTNIQRNRYNIKNINIINNIKHIKFNV